MPHGLTDASQRRPLAPNAPDSYVVKRGDTLWGIAKVFLRDPWYWPEIWQVNPQVHNPHLIYPGDTLRLVYIDGRPQIVLQRGERGDTARVEPRVRSQPLEAAITTIPYATVAAFMSKPSVLDKDEIKGAPYVLDIARLCMSSMSDGDTLYARGFTGPVEVGSSLQRGTRGRCAGRSGRSSRRSATTASSPESAHVTRRRRSDDASS